MADVEDVRRLALAWPGAVEIGSDGFDFRVSGKGFVWSYPQRRPGERRLIRTDVAVLYVGDEAEKQALLHGEPDLFFTAAEYDGHPLVLLRLPAVGSERLAELVEDAWRMRRGDDGTDPVVAPALPAGPAAGEPAVALVLAFANEMHHWRGPSPFHFVTVPDPECARIAAAAAQVTYGWGMIPVRGRIGTTAFTTSLWPKDGRYLVPIKNAVRLGEQLQLGDVVTVHLEVGPR